MEEYIKKIDLDNISMQTLAFIGDAVYNVYVRTYLASLSNKKTGKLHIDSIKYVSAKGQSEALDRIYDKLTDEEKAVYKRGRNTNIANVSKNVDVISYKKATGFEALIGYLFLKENKERLEYIINNCINILN